jgi:hypothetical protein
LTGELCRQQPHGAAALGFWRQRTYVAEVGSIAADALPIDEIAAHQCAAIALIKKLASTSDRRMKAIVSD